MELFHVMNRGVDKRTIFEDDQDFARFVHDMYEFNDTHHARNTRRRIPGPSGMIDVRRRSSGRKTIVDIHGWCLMKNHYHLLLTERMDGGFSKFLKKLNGGYAKYFNEKNKRSGALFQGKTKRIHIASDAHFLHILHYIHLNPLDYLHGAKEWRERKVSHAQKALSYLDSYRWSSYQDYCGKRNFPSVLTQNLFQGVFKDYRGNIRAYIRDIELSSIEDFLLE